MSKKYVIVEIPCEYNDEIYEFDDEGGGVPVAIYNDLEKANAKCRDLNREQFLSVRSIGYYGYEMDGVVSNEADVLKFLTEHGNLKLEEYDNDLTPWELDEFVGNLDDDKLLEFFDQYVMFEFYKVMETQQEDD